MLGFQGHFVSIGAVNETNWFNQLGCILVMWLGEALENKDSPPLFDYGMLTKKNLLIQLKSYAHV